MIKRIISILIILIIFIYPAISQSAGTPLTINLPKTQYGPNEEIKAQVAFTNFLAKPLQGSLTCAYSSVDRELPPMPQIQTLDLAPGQKSSLNCSMFVVDNMKPGVYRLAAEVRDGNNQILISPQKSDEQVLGISVQNKDNFPAFVSNLTRETRPNYSQFQISIPRLNIENSPVYVDSNDLSKGLAQLPGSALPGEKGNVFISGHSANPKNPSLFN